MAQGQLKKAKAKISTPSKGTKKGHRVIAPKKKNLIEKGKITKKYSSGLIGKTEKSLAAKAGHLEMLAGGKKDKKNATARAKQDMKGRKK